MLRSMDGVLPCWHAYARPDLSASKDLNAGFDNSLVSALLTKQG
jgi:hypothetical protein